MYNAKATPKPSEKTKYHNEEKEEKEEKLESSYVKIHERPI